MSKFLVTTIFICLQSLFNILILSCAFSGEQKEIVYSISHINTGKIDFNLFKCDDESDVTSLYPNDLNKIPDKNDIYAEFKAAWTTDKLIIFCKVNDDILYSDTLKPRNSDALEIFLSSFRGSSDVIQMTVISVNNPDSAFTYINTQNYRTTSSFRNIPVNASADSKRIGNTTYYLISIPWKSLGKIPKFGTKIAMQIYVNDVDKKANMLKNQLRWYPNGYSYYNSFSMYELECKEKASAFPKVISNSYIKDNEYLIITIYSNTLEEQKILIKNNYRTFLSTESINSFPFTVSFPLEDINADRDTVFIYVNNKLISVNDLFLIPRVYEKVKSPGLFEKEIRFFEAQDKLSFPPVNAILFIGSSSIRRWFSLKDYFPDSDIIHRGFGGSTADDALLYVDRIVLPYKPSKIVYYEGDNDIGQGFSTNKITENIERFITRVNKDLPATEIFIISPKPSIARRQLWNKFVQLNSELKKLCDKYYFVSFIDVASPMFDENGMLRNDIFVDDSLHLNEKGYEIWGQTIRREIKLN